MQNTFIAASQEDMKPIAQACVAQADIFPIILLKGEMGAGKTTLAQFIFAELGVHEPVTSPTYTLVNEYTSAAGTVYHFDLYRLKNSDELESIGFTEYLDSGYVCVIEWPELAEPYLYDMPCQEWTLKKMGTGRKVTQRINLNV